MGRLIDADMFLAKARTFLEKAETDAYYTGNRGVKAGWYDAIRLIKEMQTVDAVPVVRCKECKYGEQDDCGWICTNIDGGIMGDENGNGFCCEGERREE